MRKAILKVALSSILALSLGSANTLTEILKESQSPNTTSLAHYENDHNLYFKDAYGFTLYDYLFASNRPEFTEWLAAKNITSGVTPALIQRAQIWLFLLNYPVDNLEGNFTRAFQDNVLHYQTENGLSTNVRMSPEWFIDLESRAIKQLLTELKRQNSTLSESQFTEELAQAIQARLPEGTTLLSPFTATGSLSPSSDLTKGQIRFEIPSQSEGQPAEEILINLDVLQEHKGKELQSLPTSLMTFFDLNRKEIEKITQNPRSQKTLTLQTWLRIAGYFPPPLTIDGMNGADSREAIKRYQTAIHQPADGIPHVRWEEPLEVLIRSRAQQQLQLLNLYNREINGRNDAATRNAIRRFEKSVGLPETGTLAPNVLMHLFSTQFLPQNAGIIVDPILKVTESSSNHSAPLAGNHNASIAPITQITQATQVTQAPAEQATLTVMPVVVQQTLTQLFRQQQALEAQANAEREAAEKRAANAAKKAEIEARLQALIELKEPLQSFSLTRAEVDRLIIKARRSDIFFTQTALYLLKLYDGDLDGANGPATREAIRRFEAALGQRETGEILPRWQTPLRQIMYRLVQYRLTEMGFYQGDIDGVSGPSTRQAILNYEKANHTEEVGRLTPALLLTLFNTDLSSETNESPTAEEIPTDSVEDVTDDGTTPVSAEEDQELQADTNTNHEKYRAAVKGLDLSHKKSTEEVALIQLQLAYLGFYKGTIDGLTGPGSTRAITAFQKEFQLPTTGKLDQRTKDKLEIENINKFQRYLKRTGYMKDPETGKMGPKTRRAVGILKNRYGYSVNESLDIPAYLILIDEEQRTTIATIYYENVIKAREQEQALIDTQSYLIGFGILKGKADGKIGPATERAISTYRSQQGLAKGNQIDTALLESFKKTAPKQAQAYLQQLGYPIKPDGIFGNNSKKQLNAFLKSQNKPASDVITASILMELKLARDAKAAAPNNANNRPTAAPTTTTAPRRGTTPRFQQGLQVNSILSNAPSNTVNGPLQIIKNNSGAIVGCKVRNITMAADWCSAKRNGSSCRVLYKNGRVLSMNCR